MIILASASTWRANLLTGWGVDYKIVPTNIDESKYQQTISDPKLLVETLAQKKYVACFQTHPHQSILAADTIIYFQGQLIGKPQNRVDAQKIIHTLAGHTHQVWTGVCINGNIFSDVALVAFKSMTDSQIESYLDTNDWIGKAGAYQVQKSIKPYIENIEGDINTIIGLPTTTKNKLVLV